MGFLELIKEYKTALLFLLKFLGIYLVFNLIYGVWVEGFAPVSDPFTYFVSGQTITLLEFFYDGLDYEYYPHEPLVWLALDKVVIINAFEGCNGINVMILFFAFIIAYKGPLKQTIIYTLGGILVIHLANIIRIALLFVVAERFESLYYFTHKYLFTATIYGVVFLIWFFWVKGINQLEKREKEYTDEEELELEDEL